MKSIDVAAAALLFLLGCVHNFVAAPLSSDVLDTRALWFVTGGITLWYASIINLMGLRGHKGPERVALVFSNLVLAGFAFLFIWVRESWTSPQNIALLAPALWLLARSVFRLGAGTLNPQS
jgi:hypothetical protein